MTWSFPAVLPAMVRKSKFTREDAQMRNKVFFHKLGI